MASKKLLGLVVLCLFLYLTECKRFGGGGSRGGSSWGKGWGGSSSSSSWSKPSSSGSSWSSSGSSYKPSSSWNTGSSSGSSWGSSSISKPSWSSGSSSGSHSYPTSSSGLSGSSWGSSGNSYKPTWSSGSSSGSHSYPSSSTGLSGSGSGSNSHSYPSNTGLSGSGSSWYKPSSSNSHSYPSSSTGLSGSGSSSRYPSSNNNYNQPRNTYNTNSGYHTTHYQHHYIPTYYTAPQHVYVTQYRDSGSRYGDLLTGLTLYNMGRSHSYHDHYYSDDYYRHRYSTGNMNQGSSYNKPNSDAVCTLRITENGRLDVLKIPCEIVSTFSEGSKKIEGERIVDHTVCTTNITVTKRTVSPVSAPTSTIAPAISTTANGTQVNTTTTSSVRNVTESNTMVPVSESTVPELNVTNYSPLNITDDIQKLLANATSNITMTGVNSTVSPTIIKSNKTEGNATIQTVKVETATETIVNTTVCTTQNYTDPLKVKGSRITDTSNMECAIDIKTRDAYFRNSVECKTLMEYARMPPPGKENKPLLPPRETLKKWIEKPPWWMSMFIAV